MRQKAPLESTVNKYIQFLTMVKSYSRPAQNYVTLQSRVRFAAINKTVIKALTKLEVIHWVDDLTWTWLKGDADRTQALEVLNFLLELNKKQIVTPIAGLDDATKGYIKAIHDHLISNSQKKPSAVEAFKTSMLGRALNQHEQKTGNTLFSEVQSEQDKKFDLLKSFAPGIYQSLREKGFTTPQINDEIINATEDLFNKFFSKK